MFDNMYLPDYFYLTTLCLELKKTDCIGSSTSIHKDTPYSSLIFHAIRKELTISLTSPIGRKIETDKIEGETLVMGQAKIHILLRRRLHSRPP